MHQSVRMRNRKEKEFSTPQQSQRAFDDCGAGFSGAFCIPLQFIQGNVGQLVGYEFLHGSTAFVAVLSNMRIYKTRSSDLFWLYVSILGCTLRPSNESETRKTKDQGGAEVLQADQGGRPCAGHGGEAVRVDGNGNG